MNKRQKSGGTLALVIVAMVVIIMIGVGVAILIQIFGGHREGQNAGDSGSLGVAKQAVRRPSIRDEVSSDTFLALRELGDTGAAGEVNLLTYNRLVGSALLVLMNAQAEGTTAAATNAANLVSELQAGANSVAGKLNAALTNANAGNQSSFTYNLRDEYERLTDQHHVKMGGVNPQSSIDGTNYQVGYYLETDTPPTNIRLQGMPTALNFDTGAAIGAPAGASTTGVDGQTYLKGYSAIPITVGGTTINLFGVPTYPRQSPHLISQRDFRQTNPGGGTALLPPNAFRNQSRLTQNGKGNGLEFDARAVVGVVDGNSLFVPRIRRGYLVIDNRGNGTTTSFSPTGSSVLAAELGTGIYVSGSYPNAVFSTDQNALLNWKNYDHTGSPPSEKPANAPSIDNLKFTDGSNATWQQAWSLIPKNGNITLCTDLNTASNPCAALIDPHAPETQGPFDLAYHNGANLQGSQTSGSGLMAVEVAKCKVWEAYYVPPFSACVSNLCSSYFTGISSTGMRLFPTGHVPWQGESAPWGTPGSGFAQVPGNSYSAAQTCQVTSNGTLRQIINQSFASGDYFQARGNAAPSVVQGSSADPKPTERVRQFIENRIKQIKPNATTAEIDNVLDTTIQIGRLYFVYCDSSEDIVCTEAAPPDADANVQPDGVVRRFIKRYDLAEVVANSQFDNNIHDHHFMSQISPDTLYGFNTVAVHPATGAQNGFLGVIRLQNDAGCIQQPAYNSGGQFFAAGANTGEFSLCNRD